MLTYRFISLVAAYAIALQAILPFAVAVAHGVDPAICSSAFEPVNQPAAPHSGDQCCIVVCSFTYASALPVSPALHAALLPARNGAKVSAADATRTASAYQQTPQSRAPPAS